MLRPAAVLSLLALLACAPSGSPVPPPAVPAPAAAASEPPVVAPPAPTSEPRASELRVGTSGDYAPFSVRREDGALGGFDVELAERLASDLGLSLRWVPFRWPELSARMSAGEFDVVMGGVTWQPARAVVGYMTRSVGRGGPCLLGDASARRVGVNHGGVLEAWARGHLADRELVVVDDNQSLPRLLEGGSVGAIVTDSFERRAFERPGWRSRCEPALARKVYWVGPARSAELGARIDAWLSENTAWIQDAQERWFGQRQKLDATTHLVDLLARRLAFMPIVAAFKQRRGLPIEDLEREREVLDATAAAARRAGLPEAKVVELFALQIELSKAVQERQREPSSLDVPGQVRPQLSELGERIVLALVAARADRQLERLELADLELLSPWLMPAESERLLASLRAIQ